MKFSILENYKFAVTKDGKHFEVPSIPTLTQALELKMADLKRAVESLDLKEKGNHESHNINFLFLNMKI